VDFLRRVVTVDRQLVTVVGREPFLAPPKTSASVRAVPLPQAVLDALAAHLGAYPADGLVFTSQRVRPAVLLGALAWWAFDIAVLWACFRAFGEAPPVAVLVMGYFTGMLGNLLPLPGGLGGVEGGMIGAFLAFGVSGGLAVVAVLSYRAFAFWLPTLPGAIAYLQLRRTVKDWAAAP